MFVDVSVVCLIHAGCLCMFQLDSGVSEKICLMSRDEQSILVVSYAELKQCFESAFAELVGS